MEVDSPKDHRQLSRKASIGVALAAIILGVAVLFHINHSPRTDDAEVFANFIGIAPQVEGPIVRLNVRDNQFVKKGDLLFEIDERPYEYSVERTVSEQATLEGQIADVADREGARLLIYDDEYSTAVSQAMAHFAKVAMRGRLDGLRVGRRRRPTLSSHRCRCKARADCDRCLR